MLRQSAAWLLAVSATGELQPEIGALPGLQRGLYSTLDVEG
jgi:hypothetical protein